MPPKLGIGRGDRIRTCDLLVPNQALYQAKLHPEKAGPSARALDGTVNAFHGTKLAVMRP